MIEKLIYVLVPIIESWNYFFGTIWDMEIFSKNSIWFLKLFYLSIFRVPCLMSLIAKYFKISSFKGRTCIVDSQSQVFFILGFNPTLVLKTLKKEL